MAQGVVKCELCLNDEDGTFFCKNCHQSLCEGCKTSHLRANISKHHEIISRKEMFNTQGETARHVEEYCTTHAKEIYILFCKKCQCLICRICLMKNHAQHDFIEIEKIFQEQRQKVEKYLKDLSKGVDAPSSEVYEALAKEIKDEAEMVRAQLDAATDAMLKEAKGHCQTQEQNTMRRKETAEMALKTLNKSLQSNKVSELMKAVKICDSMQTVLDSATKKNQRQKFKFVPGNKSLDETRRLLGYLEISSPSREKPAGFLLSYADLDVDTMRLRYNFPVKEMPKVRRKVAQLFGQTPFSSTMKEFSIRIRNEGESKLIGIGIAPEDYDKFCFPGWERGSYGYHADDGGIFCETGSVCTRITEECYQGDTMKCHFDVTGGIVSFFRNGNKVFETIVSKRGTYYPLVALESPGEEVMLLEKDPWSL